MNKSKWLLSRFHRYMLDRDQKMHKKGTLFCILSGGLIGLALAIMMPATTIPPVRDCLPDIFQLFL